MQGQLMSLPCRGIGPARQSGVFQSLAVSINVSCLLAGPVQACANGTVTYLGNCSTSSVIPGQLYYAGTVSEVNPSCHFASTYSCIP